MPQIKTDDHGNIIINVMVSLRRFSGRKKIIAPEDASNPPSSGDAILTALARAFHWKTLIENGDALSAEDIATRVKVDPSYVRRILRLNNISPRIISRILAGDVPKDISLAKLTRKMPVMWEEQEKLLFT